MNIKCGPVSMVHTQQCPTLFSVARHCINPAACINSSEDASRINVDESDHAAIYEHSAGLENVFSRNNEERSTSVANFEQTLVFCIESVLVIC